MSNRRAAWVLFGFLLVQAAVHWGLRVPGPLLIDEVAYHFMTRAVADGHPCEVANGYREHPSPELEVRLTHTVTAYDGCLVSKYPYLSAWLAAPLYPFLGFSSLIAINLLAHTIVLAITWWLAKRYLRSPGWALCTPLCLSLCTFFWEYAEAAWPHSLAMVFTTGAFACAIASLPDRAGERRRRELGWAAASGLLIGLGAGARLDTMLWVAIVGCAFMLPPRPRSLLAMLAGTSFGVMLLALDNYCKVDLFWPFVYKRENVARLHTYLRYAPAAGIGVLFLLGVAAWYATRTGEALRRFAQRLSVVHWAAVAAGLGLVLLAVPPTRQLLGGLIDLAVDFSALDPSRVEPAMARMPSGAVLYFGHYKKALLQSCPYLTALVLPLVLAARSSSDAPRPWLHCVPLVVLLAVFASRSWHGGLGLNMRYLMPALPMTSVLTAWVIREVRPTTPAGWSSVAAGLGATLVVYWLAEPAPSVLPEGRVLVVPVVLSGCLLLGCLLRALRGLARLEKPVALATVSLLTMALAWAALTSLAYDYPAQRNLRSYNARMAASVRARIEPDALLFVPFIDPFGALIDAERVRLANPFQDEFESFGPLARYHLGAGRPVYGAFPLPMWEQVRRRASQSGLRVGRPEVLPTGYVLAGFLPAVSPAVKAQGF
jgi:hypothetical protein